MNKPIIRGVSLVFIALCILFISGCENKEKIRGEIKEIETQIKKIDRAISYLITQKVGSDQSIVYGSPGSSLSPLMLRFLNEEDARHNRDIDAQIHELKSQKEILMIRLKTLMEKL